MKDGYAASILRVDLTSGRTNHRIVDADVAEKYVGGAGFAAKILWDETSSNTEPLSPESPLIFMTGPLTGTRVPGSSRYLVAGISPLTGILGQALSGGSWADELRHSGVDGIVITGKAERPVYLWIHNGDVEIRDARHLWGKDTYETHELLAKETDKRASAATIGVAGEKLVKLASIMNDGREGRAAARCGLGALMGSKLLKAVVVRGSLPVRILDEESLQDNAARIYVEHPPSPKNDPQVAEGEVEFFKAFLRNGGAPIKNWQKGTFEDGFRIAEALLGVRPAYCRRCRHSCSESKRTDQGERYMVWEHWGPLGTNCLVNDVEALQQAYSLCNRYGMDTISVGGAISFAMECHEKGLITKDDTQGLDLSWGNAEAVVEVVKQIGEREGFGRILGEGVRLAAEHIGGLAPEYAMHSKGLELPAHDPRAASGIAVMYATGAIGATNCEGSACMLVETYVHEDYASGSRPVIRDLGYPERLDRFATEGKGELIATTQNYGVMLNSLVVCLMLSGRVRASEFVELLNNVTGWGLDLAEFMKTGERIFNLRRMFNVRRGISRKDDTLPARILTEKRGEGGAADHLPHLGAMLGDYYRHRGWCQEGIPTEEKLRELGLEECVGCRSSSSRLSG